MFINFLVEQATLGFMKVLVSTLKAPDLQNFLFDIVHGILPWSSQSRHHLRSKVCGAYFLQLHLLSLWESVYEYSRLVPNWIKQESNTVED